MSKKINIPWIVFGAAAGAAFYLLLWWIFDCFAGRAADHLRNLIFLTGGITAAMIAAWRAQVADEQAKTESKKAETENKKANIAEQAQITDRFARALEQLNNDNVYMRIGAVHAMERIGHDSEEDVLAVLGLLASFVRGQSPAKGGGADTLPPDAKECLGVIVRLTHNYQEFLKVNDSFRLDLSASNLIPFPMMTQSYLCGFHFDNSNITYQVFSQTNFEKASFSSANLTNTFFWKCNFVRTWFTWATLNSVSFYDADMSNAALRWATCNNTDFSTAKNLTTEMLKNIIYDAKTPPKVPEGVDLPPPRENKTVPGLLPSIT